MATSSNAPESFFSDSQKVQLATFEITGLFGGPPISINFPKFSENKSEASILIIQGRNGSGKTTILRMIAGMLRLDFDSFRNVPFTEASLTLTSGQCLKVIWKENDKLPLIVSFDKTTTKLAKDKSTFQYSIEQENSIDVFRNKALGILQGINFELLGIERSILTKDRETRDLHEPAMVRLNRLRKDPEPQAERVRDFINSAQINHRKFFRSEELNILPNMLKRLKDKPTPSSRPQLTARVQAIKSKVPTMKKYGLQIDDEALEVVITALSGSGAASAPQRSLIETYIEMQEAMQASRDLISSRLSEFESIMDEFLTDKKIAVDSRMGLKITSKLGPLKESQLSSGEYHFLYMMVSALLCQQTGSIIAIDEPELSLHISWQRKLLSALARCSSGASPLFICATHSVAISAEHSDRVKVLSVVD